MSISILGIIMVSLILFLFVTQRKVFSLIDKMLIFFAIMTQIPIGYIILFKDIDVPITTSYFFSLIFIILLIVILCCSKNTKINLPSKSSVYMFLFFLICVFSTVVLAVYPPNVLVYPIAREVVESLIPASISIKQPQELIRLLLFIVIFVTFYNFPKEKQSRIKLIKILLVVTVIHSIYGLLEKYMLFPIDAGKHRELLRYFVGSEITSYSVITPLRADSFTISGFTSEPGVFAMIVGPGAGILIYCVFWGEKIFTKRIYDIISFVILLSALVLSGSTTGTITVLVIFILLVFFSLVKKRNLRLIFGSLLIMFLIGLFFRKYFTYQWEKLLIEMSNTMPYSRKMTMKYAIDVFKSSPLIGVGFGTSNSFSSLTVLLANSGIIGTVFYILFYFSIVIKLFKRNTLILFQAVGFSLVAYFIVGIFSGGFPQILNPEVWMLLGIVAKRELNNE